MPPAHRSPTLARWSRLAYLARASIRAIGLSGLGRLALTGAEGAVVQVENTNVCNQRCGYCATHSEGSLVDDPRGHMRLDTFSRILDENPRARLVVLQGDGEPLLDAGFFDKVALARSRGLATQTITNGSLLDQAMIRRLLSHGPDVVLVSVDALSPERNDAVRRGMRCKEVLASIRALTAARDEARSPLVVGLLSILHAEHLAEAEAALLSFNALGIDALFFKELNRSYENRIRGYQGGAPCSIHPAVRRRLRYPTSHQRIRPGRLCPQLAYRSPYYLWDGTRTACCILGERRYAAPEYSQASLLERFRARTLPIECQRCSYFVADDR